MSICRDCRKFEAVDTWQEKLASWFAWHLTPKTLKDEKQASRLEGFEQGYEMSGKQGLELKTIQTKLDRMEDEIFQMNKLILILLGRNLPHV